MKVGDLVKLHPSVMTTGQQYGYKDVDKNLRNMVGMIIEAHCHPVEPKDDEDVRVLWGNGDNMEHPVREVEVIE